MTIEQMEEYGRELTQRRRRELERLKTENALMRAVIAYTDFHEKLPQLSMRRCWQPRSVCTPWAP